MPMNVSFVNQLWIIWLVGLWPALSLFSFSSCLIIKEKPKPTNDSDSIAVWSKWVGEAPVLTPRFNFDNIHVVPGSVVLVDGIYEMYYSGFDSATWRIGRATSADGLTWNRTGLVLNQSTKGPDKDGVRNPAVAFDTGLSKFLMVYEGLRNGKTTLLSATSLTGRAWRRRGVAIQPGLANEFDSFSVSNPSLVPAGANYTLFYSASDSNVQSIGRAYTDDEGENWLKEGQMISPGAATFDALGTTTPYVFHNTAEELYSMWYRAEDSGSVVTLGYALSGNGYQWLKKNEFLGLGNTGSTDSVDIFDPAYITDGLGRHFLYYGGDDGINKRIHLARCIENNHKCRQASQFDKGGVVLNIQTGNEFDSLRTTHPAVVNKPNSGYRLYYTGFDGVQEAIGYADTQDPATWTRESIVLSRSAPGAFDSYSVSHPAAFWSEGNYHLYYLARDSITASYKVGYARSSHGTAFDNQQQINLPGEGIVFESGSISSLKARIHPLDGSVQIVFAATISGRPVAFTASADDGVTFATPETVFDPGADGNVYPSDSLETLLNPNTIQAPLLFTPRDGETEQLFFLAQSIEGDTRIYRLERQTTTEPNSPDSEQGSESGLGNPVPLPWTNLTELPKFNLEFEKGGVQGLAVFADENDGTINHLLYSAYDETLVHLGYMIQSFP